jgi:hypothetical protein
MTHEYVPLHGIKRILVQDAEVGDEKVQPSTQGLLATLTRAGWKEHKLDITPYGPLARYRPNLV